MSVWWQHLPERIDPIFFSVGMFSIRWYAVCFAAGMGAMWLLVMVRAQRGAGEGSAKEWQDVFFPVLLGSFVGGRLGYVLWYAPAYFSAYPERIFWPFDPLTGGFTGIAGLSFHGALLGAAAGIYWWTRKERQSFLTWMDRWVSIVPLGIIFGRLGNFLNGELWGRPTEVAWGMFFPEAGAVLRHPSPLYEMLGEGVLLFVFLAWLGRKKWSSGVLSAWFLCGYGAMRFGLEYWREPDRQIGLILGYLSLGQIFSFILLMAGSLSLWYLMRQRVAEKMCYNGKTFKARKS